MAMSEKEQVSDASTATLQNSGSILRAESLELSTMQRNGSVRFNDPIEAVAPAESQDKEEYHDIILAGPQVFLKN
jgi:hypothetical protein